MSSILYPVRMRNLVKAIPVERSGPIHLDPRVRTYARDLLEAYGEEVILQVDRVRRRAGADLLHDLRVASRRLQEALALLAPILPRRAQKRAYRRAKSIRRSVEDLRNTDVMVDLASDLLAMLPHPERVDVQPFLLRLQNQATELRRRTVKNPNGVPSIRRRMKRLLRGLPPVEPQYVRKIGENFRAVRAHRVVEAMRRASQGGPEAMHRLRIALKHYRYTVEILEKGGFNGMKAVLRETRKLQTELGRLHDQDILMAMLRRERKVPESRRLLAKLRTERKLQLQKTRDLLAQSRELLASLNARPAARRTA